MPLYTADRKDEVRSAQEVFKSRAVAAAVVDSLGPDVVLGHGSEAEGSLVTFVTKPIGWVTDWIAGLDPISERESAIITVERSLNVGGEQQATTIVLKYVANSPQLAQDVCRTIVAVGQQEYMRVHRSAQSKPFFTEQQNRLRDQLDESLEALRRAKNEMGFSSIEQRRTTLEAQYSAVELDRLSTDQQLATSQARIEDLQNQIANISERELAAKKTLPNQGADMLRNRFYELQVKSMELGARYNESHPLLMAVNEQLSEAQKVLAQQSDHRVETSDEINPIHRQLSLTMKQEMSVVAGLKARLGELEKQKVAVLADLCAVNQHDLTIDQMTREADLARDKYMQYARTMEEARIDAELQNENINNLSEAQPATLAEKPVTPVQNVDGRRNDCACSGWRRRTRAARRVRESYAFHRLTALSPPASVVRAVGSSAATTKRRPTVRQRMNWPHCLSNRMGSGRRWAPRRESIGRHRTCLD